MLRATLHRARVAAARVPPRATAGPRASRRHVVRAYATQPEGDASATGFLNAKSAALFGATALGLYAYFQHERRAAAERRAQEAQQVKSVGKPKLGGPFELINATTREPFTDQDMLGKFSLVYFGFTHCPDICPEELEKMAEVVDAVERRLPGRVLVPIFITCDPRRDGVDEVAKYVAEFHPRMVGLTGPEASVKKATRAYRVYYSTPPDLQPDEDYLVDHSIFFYLMDPEGQFVDCYGKDHAAEAVEKSVLAHMEAWRAAGKSVVLS